ncbi:DoxX family protein [Mesorhizobium sp. CN2-181]|uniref:DoxX family protein n=1 Tax=Mesorhizobium yinganensis TaxID=3157707 RepID=UPI0032B782EF
MPIDAAAILARFLLAVVFIPNGIMKLSNISGTAGYFAGLGFPMPTMVAWGSGLFELIAGLCIVAGFQTRIAAVLLALFCVVAGLTGHFGQGGDDPAIAFLHMQALLKDIGLAGGFLALALAGPGRFSIDGARG